MSYNGNGIFNINTAGQPVVAGTVISSTTFNSLTADLANGLTTALTKDGQTTPTANIPMGGFRITGLGNPAIGTDALNYATFLVGNFATTNAVTLPVGTTAQRPTPATGMVRYNSTNVTFEGYNGIAWGSIGNGATGGGADQIFVLNGQTVTVDYSIPVNYNAMSTGPVSIDVGVTVTIPPNSVWAII